METFRMQEALLSDTMNTSQNSSLLTKRKSLCPQNSLPTDLQENNDEQERLARRNEINASASLISSVNEKRHSLAGSWDLSLPDINNRITECIKLNTENKINIKNAFSLKIIDIMTYMIRKQDKNMSNLQIASTSLDASTKIYGFRVDGIHTEIMKMMGAAEKQNNDFQNNDREVNNITQENEEGQLEKSKKRKKKKNKHQIFSTVDNLKVSIETSKPSLWMSGHDDSQTTNTMYQVVVPNHANSTFYMHLYNDVIVDTVKKKAVDNIEVSIPKIPDFSELEICPPLSTFDFQNWTNECENVETTDTEPIENSEEGFQFNLNASIPSEDEVIHTSINYFDIQDEVEEDVEKYIGADKPVEKIVDLCNVVTNTQLAKISEYSFLQKSMNMHWAGPSHWKINNFKRLLEGSKVVEKCHQEPTRKKKEIELCYDDKTPETVTKKFILDKAKQKENKNWEEEMVTLPRDMHYTIASANKLYLYQHIKIENKDQLNATHISDIVENYNYNNENDVSNYCPDIPNNDYEANSNDSLDNGEVILRDSAPEPPMFVGDNLVAIPKLTNKVAIPYSVRAKRVDMRQLKKSIWTSLITNENKENKKNEVDNEKQDKMSERKCFSAVYKTLPDILTKTNIEALSFPLSFVSLLHLVNEKSLKLEIAADMSDIIVQGN